MLVVLADNEEPNPMPATIQTPPATQPTSVTTRPSERRGANDDARLSAIVEAAYILQAVRR
jgi:predicted secreted protein